MTSCDLIESESKICHWLSVSHACPVALRPPVQMDFTTMEGSEVDESNTLNLAFVTSLPLSEEGEEEYGGNRGEVTAVNAGASGGPPGGSPGGLE